MSTPETSSAHASQRRSRHRGEPAPARRLPGGRRALLAAAVLVTALLAGMTTNALWTARDAAPIGVIVSGNLEIKPVGEMVWTELTAGGEPGDEITDPSSYRAMPGDRFSLAQKFVTRLEGDNIVGRLTLDWSEANQGPAGVQLSYRVLDGHGEPASLGTATSLGVPVALDMAAGEQTWTFVVDVAIPLGTPQVRSTESFELGPLLVNLEQVLE